jgi:hypothetical protein
MRARILIHLVAFGVLALGAAQSSKAFVHGAFIVAGKGVAFFPYETFAFGTLDLGILQSADTAIALHTKARVAVRIAAGGNSLNANYFTGGYPNQFWGWSVTEIIYVESPTSVTPPSLIGLPPAAYSSTPGEIDADPAGWIASNGDIYFPQDFFLVRAFNPDTPKAAALNASLRGPVGPNAEQSIIGGITVAGNTSQGLDVIIRAIGPSLAAAGISNPVRGTKLVLYDSRGSLVYTNIGWQNDWRAEEYRTRWPSFVPSSPAESAVLINLLPGPYTVRVESSDGSSGLALIEFFNADPPDFPGEAAR